MALASEVLGVEVQRLGVVARLLVSPDHRRLGAARTLLEMAAGAGVERQLVPILDVATHFRAAIALYEHCGWIRAGEVEVWLPSG
jgi:GNAT superfamily N-acetyltransferase